MSASLTPSLFLTIGANGSLSAYDAGVAGWLAATDPYFHDSPTTLYTFVVLSLLALVVVLPALAWHVRARNLAAASIASWTVWLNASDLANALIWPTDDLVSAYHGEGYCDVAAKLAIAADVGLVCGALCILRSLAAALNTSSLAVYTPPAEKRRKLLFECLVCVGIPAAHAVSHLLVQDARYMIYAGAGCAPTWQSSIASVVLIGVPPVLLALVAAAYAALVLVRVTRYRRDFAAVLSASSAGVSVARFFRLYSLSVLLVVVYLPFKLHDLYLDASAALQPFDWDAAHAPGAWSDIRLFPMFGAVLPFLWTYIGLAAAVVVTIGLGSDAHAFYRDALLTLGFGDIFPSLTDKSSLRFSDAASSAASAARAGPGPRDSANSCSSASSGAKKRWWSVLAEPAAAHLGFGAARMRWAGAGAALDVEAYDVPVRPPPAYESVRACDAGHRRAVSAEEATWHAMEARLGIR